VKAIEKPRKELQARKKEKITAELLPSLPYPLR